MSNAKQKQITCPQCGRTLTAKENKFHDLIYPQHRMATAWTKKGRVSEEASEDLRPDHNPAALYTHELPCPMSGQPV